MKKLLIRTMDIITAINKSMVWIIGTLVLFMSMLLTIDVILRYFFNSPTSWAFDFSTWGTGVIGFLLGGYTLVAAQHVRVDLFFEKFSLRMKSIIDLVSAIFLFMMVIALVWLGTDYVIHYYNIGAQSTGGFAIPLWVKWLIVPIGGLLIGLQGLVKLIDDIYIIVTGKRLYEMEEKA